MMKRKPLIAFIGIDGAGKTTLIKKVRIELEKGGEKSEVIYMGLGSNHHIPFLKQVMKMYSRLRYGDKINKMTYHQSRDNFRERSPFWVLVQYAEFWVRYLRAKTNSKKQIILFDRFFYDGLILGNKLSFKIFRHLTPKIDLGFLITAPPKVIRGRKKEAGIKDIEKYYKKAERLLEFFPIIKINNDKKMDLVVKDIFKEISSLKKERVFPEKKLYDFFNENKIRYIILRGSDEISANLGKDLDILILKEDYDKLKLLKIPAIGRYLDFYIEKENHHGVVFLNKKTLFRRKFDSDKGFFILSKQDYLRMKFFRKSLKIYWFFRRLIEKFEKKK